MRNKAFLLYICLLALPTLACKIVVESKDNTLDPIANALPTPAESVPTLKPTLDTCLIVRALPHGDGSLNLRAGPGTGYGVRAVLADGQKMVMDGKSGDWYAVGVVMDDALLTGWVNKAYVEACEWK